MAEVIDKKISELTERTTLTGAEEVPFAEDGANGKFKMSAVLDVIDTRIGNIDAALDAINGEVI